MNNRINIQSNDLNSPYKTVLIEFYPSLDVDNFIDCLKQAKSDLLADFPEAFNIKFEGGYDKSEYKRELSCIVPKNKKEINEDDKIKKEILNAKIEKAKQLLKENGIKEI